MCAGAVLATLLLITACAPVADPSAGLPPDQSVALIDTVEPSTTTLASVAEAFALNTRATDVQRQNLEASLIGRRVEWDIPVYEVSLNEGRYQVTSQPIPIEDQNAAPLIRVYAVIVPTGDADKALLESIKTDDTIRVRGIVQEIRLRSVVALVPAALVQTARPAQETTNENEGA